MGAIAFVFSGQGAQFPGMGQALYQGSPAARRVFEQADAIRPGTSRQCFEGTDEELRETKNTQPCMFAVELAAAAALAEAGVHGDMAAGFSLGELAALTYTGAVDFETGFRLVCRRGELMQRDAERRPTFMAAVLRLENEDVERLCAQFSEIYPVNYNCPGQVSVSGAEEEMTAFFQAVKEAGGRALPLKVRGGFHSPFMSEAAEAFAGDLNACRFAPASIPLYSNLTGEVYGEDYPGLLSAQIRNPVRWERIVRNMLAAGADRFVELGPGSTLCGLIRKTDKSAHTYAVCSIEDIKTVQEETRSC